ncbi:hypothetical protein ACHWQZ_G017789 [Mnemiopsis leidyi]
MNSPRLFTLVLLFVVPYIVLYTDFTIHVSLLLHQIDHFSHGSHIALDNEKWAFLFDEQTLSYNYRLISYVRNELHGDPEHRFSKLIRKSHEFLRDVRKRCEKEKLVTHWGFEMNPVPKPRMLIKREKEKIVFASNPKTGTTSFKRFLFYLDGNFELLDRYHDKPRGHFGIIEDMKADQANFRFSLGQYIKIGMVRNPLTRLVSAFRDKQLRKFEFFKPGVNHNRTDFETFTRFIDTILPSDTGKANIHLAPQWDQMKVCQWPYDLLIPYENLSEYLELFTDMTGTGSTPYPGSRENVGADSHGSSFYSELFFTDLDQRRMDVVYDHYKLDFKLLGYSRFGDKDFPNLKNFSIPG